MAKVDIEKAKMIFWDVGGQVSLRALWDKYYGDAHALVFVFDGCDPDRLPEAQRELERLLHDPELADAPLLLMANKQDVPGAMKCESLTSVFATDPAPKRLVRLQNLTAMGGNGVREGLLWLTQVLPKCERSKRISRPA